MTLMEYLDGQGLIADGVEEMAGRMTSTAAPKLPTQLGHLVKACRHRLQVVPSTHIDDALIKLVCAALAATAARFDAADTGLVPPSIVPEMEDPAYD